VEMYDLCGFDDNDDLEIETVIPQQINIFLHSIFDHP
jgi:hypothetical protein